MSTSKKLFRQLPKSLPCGDKNTLVQGFQEWLLIPSEFASWGTGAFSCRPGFFHYDLAVVVFAFIQFVDGFVSFIIVLHFNETKSF
jgi:hypothetical protein